MDENRKKLYDQLSANYDMGTFDEFDSDLDNEDNQKVAWEAMGGQDGYGDFGLFQQAIQRSPQAAEAGNTETTETTETTGATGSAGITENTGSADAATMADAAPLMETQQPAWTTTASAMPSEEDADADISLPDAPNPGTPKDASAVNDGMTENKPDVVSDHTEDYSTKSVEELYAGLGLENKEYSDEELQNELRRSAERIGWISDPVVFEQRKAEFNNSLNELQRRMLVQRAAAQIEQIQPPVAHQEVMPGLDATTAKEIADARNKRFDYLLHGESGKQGSPYTRAVSTQSGWVRSNQLIEQARHKDKSELDEITDKALNAMSSDPSQRFGSDEEAAIQLAAAMAEEQAQANGGHAKTPSERELEAYYAGPEGIYVEVDGQHDPHEEQLVRQKDAAFRAEVKRHQEGYTHGMRGYATDLEKDPLASADCPVYAIPRMVKDMVAKELREKSGGRSFEGNQPGLSSMLAVLDDLEANEYDRHLKNAIRIFGPERYEGYVLAWAKKYYTTIANARVAVDNMIRNEIINQLGLKPSNNWEYLFGSVLNNTFVTQGLKALYGLEKDARPDDFNYITAQQAAYRQYEDEHNNDWQDKLTQMTTPALTLVADAVTGGFFLAGKAAQLTSLLPRLFYASNEAATRSLMNSAIYRIFMGSLSGAANFATYEMQSMALQQLATGEYRKKHNFWSSLGHAGVSGAAKGMVFGTVGEAFGSLFRGVSGKMVYGVEAGKLLAETATFSAMGYLENGNLTFKDVGTNFGLALSGRASHAGKLIKDIRSRANNDGIYGSKANYHKISEAEKDALVALGYGDVASALRGENISEPMLRRMQNQLEQMRLDKRVSWETIRCCDWVLNGQLNAVPGVRDKIVEADGKGGYTITAVDANGRAIMGSVHVIGTEARNKVLSSINHEIDKASWVENESKMQSSLIGRQLVETVHEYAESTGEDAEALLKTYMAALGKDFDHKSLEPVEKKVFETINALRSGKDQPTDIADTKETIGKRFGVDIDQAIKTEKNQRTKEQRAALAEYQEWLDGREDIIDLHQYRGPAIERPYYGPIRGSFERKRNLGDDEYTTEVEKWRGGVMLGKVVVVNSLDEVTDAKVRKQIEEGDAAGNKSVPGWYDSKTDTAYIYAPHIIDGKDFNETMLHEVVSHKGLRGLLGEADYNKLLDKIWEDMSPSERKAFEDYPGGEENESEVERTRRLADEWLAHRAQGMDVDGRNSIWQTAKRHVKDWLRRHGIDVYYSDYELENKLRESYRELAGKGRKTKTERGGEGEPRKEDPIIEGEPEHIHEDKPDDGAVPPDDGGTTPPEGVAAPPAAESGETPPPVVEPAVERPTSAVGRVEGTPAHIYDWEQLLAENDAASLPVEKVQEGLELMEREREQAHLYANGKLAEEPSNWEYWAARDGLSEPTRQAEPVATEPPAGGIEQPAGKREKPYRTKDTDPYGVEHYGYDDSAYDKAFELEKEHADELDKLEGLNDEEYESAADEIKRKLPHGFDVFYDKETGVSHIEPAEPTRYGVGNLHETNRKFKIGDHIQLNFDGRHPHVIVTRINENGKVVEAIDAEDGRVIIRDGKFLSTDEVLAQKKLPKGANAEAETMEPSELPMTEHIARMVDAWGDVTRVEVVGQNDNGTTRVRLWFKNRDQRGVEADVDLRGPQPPEPPTTPTEPTDDATTADTTTERPTEVTGSADDQQMNDVLSAKLGEVDEDAERRAAQEADPYYMPMENKGGGRMSPNYRKATAEQIFNHLNDRENESGRGTLDGNIADGVKRAEDKVRDIERREPKGKGRSDKSLTKWEKELSEARAQLEKWREVERMRREQKAAEGDDSDPTWKQVYDEFNSSDEEPVNLEDYVARHLYGTKFKWKDKEFVRLGGRTHGLGGHLGLSKSDKERRAFFGWIDEKNGSYPESVAESLYANMPDWMRERYDTMEILDAVLNVVGSNPRPRDMVVDYVKRLREQNRDMDEYYADEAAGARGFHDAGEMDAYDNMREREAAGFHDVAAAGREADSARADLLADAQARLADPNASEFEKQAARTVLRYRQRNGRDGVTAQGTEDDVVRYRIRTKEPPKKTRKVYKLMRLGEDGKLYPLFIDSASPVELGTWYDADSPNLDFLKTLTAGVHLVNAEAGESMTLEQFSSEHPELKIRGSNPNAAAIDWATANGMRWMKVVSKDRGQRRYGGELRSYYNYGINGSGAVETYALRPGWHAGSLPTMRQIGKGPNKNLRDNRFVWVEGEVAADVDYQGEADANPDKDIPGRIPEDGYYLKATNADKTKSQADRVGWFVSGAFKANRIISDAEARRVIDQWNAEHPGQKVEYDYERESGVEFSEADAARVNGGTTENGGVSFRVRDDERRPTFYSNAERAVENVKQGKATAEQWKAMLTKAGGIKAGEDKWMGLTEWLDEHKGQSLTKDDVLQFVRDNGIRMEEVNYGGDVYSNPRMQELQTEYRSIYDNLKAQRSAAYDELAEFNNKMVEKYGTEAWHSLLDEGDKAQHQQMVDDFERKFGAGLDDAAMREMTHRYGDDFASGFDGVVGNLRVGYGFNGIPVDAAKYYLGDINSIESTRELYTTRGLANKREIAFVVPGIEPYQQHDEIHFGPENGGRAVMWVRFGEARDTDGNRVLVIDEVQSNRHQDARERGYRSQRTESRDYKFQQAADALTAFRKELEQKYGEFFLSDDLTEAETKKYEELRAKLDEAYAMPKDEKDYIVPDAPFEKNWMEVAMKRMLRLAADEGFDKVAWTTGEQQADRYDLGDAVKSIKATDSFPSGFKEIDIELNNDTGSTSSIRVAKNNGEIVRTGSTFTSDWKGKNLRDVVGKELAERLLADGQVNIRGEALRIGGEGMKGFYDEILPRFMNKYGKKWGSQVGEVKLSTPGGEVMHSVDVTEPMRDSVMQGQPLFRVRRAPNGEESRLDERQYDEVRTDNFKKWFGDWENDPEEASKVVDKNGEPLVVWHGGLFGQPYGEEAYAWDADGSGGWFSSDRKYAEGYLPVAGNPTSVYLDIRNPFELKYNEELIVENGKRTPKLHEIAHRLGVSDDTIYNMIDWDFADGNDVPAFAINRTKEFADLLREKGYDGAHSVEFGSDAYMILDPTQIKSATENNGDFSRENPDIRFRTRELEDVRDELGENGISIDDKGLLDRYDLKNVTLSKHGNYVTLTHFIADEQGQGNGTRFMEDLTKLADQNGWTLALTPDTSFGGTSVKRLKDFYKRFGFKDNTGSRRDFETRESMIRRPNEQLSQNDSEVIFDAAKNKFGVTDDIREAGYILPDGSMLDFSGRNMLDPGTDSSFLKGRRTSDHRDIGQIGWAYDENGNEYETGLTTDMADFISRGAIRIDNNAGSINLSMAPTREQEAVLRRLIANNDGNVWVDFGDGNNTDHYAEYSDAKATRILGDIDRYFSEGIKPEGNLLFRLRDNEKAEGVTLFSGGGLIEAGLRGIVEPRAAVEYDRRIAGVYRDNYGNHIVTADVRDVDPMELAEKVNGPVQYFHASPVCKNFSPLKQGGEKPLDIETAQSTANAIDKMRPRIVTIENVARYENSDAMKAITDKLDELGYKYDVHVVDAADYGAATHRRRLILRAVDAEHELPEFPQPSGERTGWYERVEDLVGSLPESTMPEWMSARLANDGIDWRNVDRPLIVMSSGASYGKVPHAWAEDAAPTIVAGRTGDRIVLPGGKVLSVNSRVLARLMGLSDDYMLPKSESLAHTILGNGVPVELTRNVIGPMVREVADAAPDGVGERLDAEQRKEVKDEIRGAMGTTIEGSSGSKGIRLRLRGEHETGDRVRVRREGMNDGRVRVEGLPGEWHNIDEAGRAMRLADPEHLYVPSDDGNWLEVHDWRDNEVWDIWRGKPGSKRYEKWRERTLSHIHKQVPEYAKKLGLDVELIDNEADVPAGHEREKSWYDTETGKVHIVVPRHAAFDVSDVMSSLWHEGVSRHGLRKLVGGDNYDTFLDNVYATSDANIRAEIDRLTEEVTDGDRRGATEEYLSRLAEQMGFQYYKDGSVPVRGWMQRGLKVMRENFDKLCRHLGMADMTATLRDDDLRAVLYDSYNHLLAENRDAYAAAKRAEREDKEYVKAVKRGDIDTAMTMLHRKLAASEGIVGYAAPHGHGGSHREVSHRLKDSESGAIEQAARDMAQYVPKDAVLVPMPPHEGVVRKDTDTWLLAQELSRLTGAPVVAALRGRERESRYAAKQAGRKGLSADELGFYQDMELPDGKTPVFVDNVVGSGETAKAAVQAMGGRGMTLAYTKGNLGKPTDGLKNVTVTYDDAGNLIPLSERFDRSKSDVRFRQRDGRHGSDSIEGLREEHSGHEAAVEDARRRLESDDASEFERTAARAVIKAYGGGSGDTPDGGGPRFRIRDDADMLVDMTKHNNEVARQRRDAVTDFVKAVTDVDELTDSKFATALGKVMRGQRQYDQETVADITTMVKAMMDAGLLTELDNFSVKQILTKVKDSTGKNDTTAEANKLIDIMLKHQLKRGKRSFEQQLKVKGMRQDSRGVVVQGGLDYHGQRAAKALKEGLALGDLQAVNDRIDEAEQRLSDPDEVVRGNAADELEGLYIARQYYDEIKQSEIDEANIKSQLEQAQADHKNGTLSDEAYKQLRQASNDALRELRCERVDAWARLNEQLSDRQSESAERAKQFREQQKQRQAEIQHWANSDMEGHSADPHEQETRKKSAGDKARDVAQAVLQPLGTFDKLMRYFGNSHPKGEGYLFGFVRRFMNVRDQWFKERKADFDQMDAAARRIGAAHGRDIKDWAGLYRLIKKLPKLTVTVKGKDYEITQGNATYLLAMEGQADGRMKLRSMGLTEADMDALRGQVDPMLLELSDWVIHGLLPGMRPRLNATHIRMFGADMTDIPNYFPIRTSKLARNETVNLAQQNGKIRPATITGSIIERKRNNLDIDLGADFFQVAAEHVDEMNHWNSFAELARDLNTLLSYKRFKAQVHNLHSWRYGNGADIWKTLEDTAAITTGDYQPKTSKSDAIINGATKGLAAANITFRPYTGLKQLLSSPVYLVQARWDDIGYSLSNLKGTWQWAIENLPTFAERWQGRMAGDPILTQAEQERGSQNKKRRWLSKAGFAFNAAVDAVTVAIGARAIYRTKYRRYKDIGYSDEQANQKALEDASISVNETQQSGLGAFTSVIQQDRTFWSRALTIYRNASMGYQRQLAEGLKAMRNGVSSEWRTTAREKVQKKLERDGIDPAMAAKVADRLVNREAMRGLALAAMFGSIAPFVWALGAQYLGYKMAGGDDDEQEDKMLSQASTHLASGWLEGIVFGGQISSAADFAYDYFHGRKKLRDYSLQRDLVSDMAEQILGKSSGKPADAVYDIVNMIVAMSTGVNPKSIVEPTVGIIDVVQNWGGDAELAHEVALGWCRLLNVPQTSLDQVYVDEIGLSAKDAKQLSAEEFAERWCRYKRRRGAGWMSALTSDESDKEQEGKLLKRYERMMDERFENLSAERVEQILRESDDELLKKHAAKAYKSRIDALTDDEVAAAVVPLSDNAPQDSVDVKREGIKRAYKSEGLSYDTPSDRERNAQAYERHATYDDIAEDTALKGRRDALKKSVGDKIEKMGVKYKKGSAGWDWYADDDASASIDEIKAYYQSHKAELDEYGILLWWFDDSKGSSGYIKKGFTDGKHNPDEVMKEYREARKEVLARTKQR